MQPNKIPPHKSEDSDQGTTLTNLNKSIDEINPIHLMNRFDFTNQDQETIRKWYHSGFDKKIPIMVNAFYDWLIETPEFNQFFNGDEELRERVQASQIRYWKSMLECNIDDEFVKQRTHLAQTHLRIKLPLSAYITAFGFITNWVVADLSEQKDKGLVVMSSFLKLQQLDMFLVVTEYHSLFQNLQNELLQQAELVAKAKSHFLSTMSHEIRTPLNAIIGISNLLLENEHLPEQLNNIDALKFSSNSLVSLINDILDFNKIDANKMTFEMVHVNTRDLLSNIYNLHKPVAQSKQIGLKLTIGDDLPPVISDPTRLAQVLNNMISNAIKFTYAGEVEIILQKVKEDENYCTLDFCVKDTGIGLQEESQQHIFDAFTQASAETTRNYGGTGLGLAICKRIVGALGGVIEVESVFGSGSSFSFSLNFEMSNQDGDTTQSKTESDIVQFKGETILYAEDNEMNCMVGQQFFNKWGLTVVIAKDGVDAVEILKNSDIKLVLMDCQMPRLDGYSATRQIREFNKEVPIIALTASILFEDREKIIDCGMNDYVYKPFKPAALNNKIAKYLKYMD
jgi:signal transduction histidine kinase/CheY-like chemotaxis protein